MPRTIITIYYFKPIKKKSLKRTVQKTLKLPVGAKKLHKDFTNMAKLRSFEKIILKKGFLIHSYERNLLYSSLEIKKLEKRRKNGGMDGSPGAVSF